MNQRIRFASRVIRVATCLTIVSGTALSANAGVAERIDELMQCYHANRHFHGAILVAEDGKITYSKAFGLANIEDNIPNTLTTRFGLASVSKQFTSMLVLQLVETGKLRLDGTVTDYLPDYPLETGNEITVHHLLTHTSGIYQDSPTKGKRAENRFEKHSRDELMAYFMNHALLFPPGDDFQYSNFNYNLLAIIVEAVTSRPYADLLQEMVFDPLGMKNTCVGKKSRPGSIAATGYDYEFLAAPRPVDITHESVAVGAGDLYSTVEDLFLWDQALYSDALLTDKYREMLFTVHTSVGYAYGWQQREYPAGAAGEPVVATYHDGGSEGTQCCIFRLIKDKKMFVVLSNRREPWIHIRLSRPKEDMAPNIIKALYGGNFVLPGRSAAHDIAVAAENSGAGVITGEFDELVRSIRREYAVDSDEFYNVGLSYLWNSEYQKAYAFLRIAVDDLGIDHLGHGWQCLAVYGEAAFRCRHFDDAIRSLEESLRLNPGNSSAVYWLNRARALKRD